MARKPKGRTRFVVKQEKQSENKAATVKLAAGLQAREEKERKKKLSDPTYVKKMGDLEERITEKREIIDKRTQEIMEKTAPRLIKLGTEECRGPRRGRISVHSSVEKTQDVNTVDKFKVLPLNNFAKYNISPKQIAQVIEYVSNLLNKYSVNSTEHLKK